MSLLALMAGLAIRWLPQGSTSGHVSVHAREVAAALRVTRGRAIADNRPMRFMVNVEHRSYQVEGQQQHLLPEDIKLTLHTAESQALSNTVGTIKFFPDGSSTGGRIGLTTNGKNPIKQIIGIDWFTGRIKFADK